MKFSPFGAAANPLEPWAEHDRLRVEVAELAAAQARGAPDSFRDAKNPYAELAASQTLTRLERVSSARARRVSRAQAEVVKTQSRVNAISARNSVLPADRRDSSSLRQAQDRHTEAQARLQANFLLARAAANAEVKLAYELCTIYRETLAATLPDDIPTNLSATELDIELPEWISAEPFEVARR